MAPHLLTIPREIRNNIYDYLFHRVYTVCLNDDLGVDNYKDGDDKVLEIQVVVDPAPLVDVMLIHPRIYEEYRESTMFKGGYTAAFLIGSAAHLVVPLNRQLTSSLGPLLPHLRHTILTYERNDEIACMVGKFKESILRAQGMRSLRIAHRKIYPRNTFETIAQAERHYSEAPQKVGVKFQEDDFTPPPPGMTLIQKGLAAGFDTCSCSPDHVNKHKVFGFEAFAACSGDEDYWTPEDILNLWPLLRDGLPYRYYLSNNTSEQELNSIAMQRLRKLGFWKELYQNIDSEVIDSITTTYLGGKDWVDETTVPNWYDEACRTVWSPRWD